MRSPAILALILAAAWPAAAQLRVDFYPHSEVRIGPYQMYACVVCNGSAQPAEIRGANVWHQAAERGGFTPQLWSVILAERDYKGKTSLKAWGLRALSWSAAGGTVLAGSKALGNINTNTAAGKALVIAGPTVSTISGLAAEHLAKVPERDTDPRIDAILPGTISLAPRDCSPQYVMWGVPLEVQP